MSTVAFFCVNNPSTTQTAGLGTATIPRGPLQQKDSLWIERIALHITTKSQTAKVETIIFIDLL